MSPGPDWLDQQWTGGRADHCQRPGGGLLRRTGPPEVIWWEAATWNINLPFNVVDHIKPIMSLVFSTEKLSGRKLNVAEVTQSEIGQKQKLQTVLEAVNELLRPHGWTIEWSVDCECHIDGKHPNTGAHPWIFHFTSTLSTSYVIAVPDSMFWFPASAIHSKNLVAIVYLLVALAMHFQAPIRLPEHVSVQVVVVKARRFLSVRSDFY